MTLCYEGCYNMDKSARAKRARKRPHSYACNGVCEFNWRIIIVKIMVRYNCKKNKSGNKNFWKKCWQMFNPFVGTGKSTKSDQNGKKIFFSENSHLGVFGYAESESVVKIKKFKMASSIWRTKMWNFSRFQ